MRRIVALMVISAALYAASVMAGGEMPGTVVVGPPVASQPEPSASAPTMPHTTTIAPSKLGPPAGTTGMCRTQPLPVPYRPVGWGFNCQEFYGPTYYYPSKHNNYEGLNPTYYPFYHPRLWPNYKTDAILRARLKKETGKATVIIVAQRVSTIMHADKIIVMNEGEVVGQGTHKELLRKCEIYYDIASSQMSKEELA